MKTAELSGAALDWAVAKAEGCALVLLSERWVEDYAPTGGFGWGYISRYSTSWADGGPIIEREHILSSWFTREGEEPMWRYWKNGKGSTPMMKGPTALVAAMRCYVASKLGDEVDIPKELL